MTVSRALEVLGLTGKPSQDEVRRAYLRAVKQHPPERDGEGFQRVREAFEFLKTCPWSIDQEVEGESDEEEPETTEQPETAGPPAEPLVRAGPGESFPEFREDDVEQRVNEISALLQQDDPIAAAATMVRLYRRPLLETGPLPPPTFALQTYLLLVERQHLNEARELLDAFEASAEQRPVRADAHEAASQWRFASEVAELIDIDARLASAVAAGLRHGNLHAAARAARLLDWRDGGLQQRLASRTPRVWGRLSSLVQAPIEPLKSGGSPFSTWWAWLVGVVLLNMSVVGSHCIFDDHPAKIASPPVANAQTEPKSLDAVLTETRVTMASMTEEHWGLLKAELDRADCARVRARWTVYSPLARVGVDAQTTASRKLLISHTCPDLAEFLETTKP